MAEPSIEQPDRAPGEPLADRSPREPRGDRSPREPRGDRNALHRQGLLTLLLALGALVLLGLLSERHFLRLDLTASARNTLSPASRELVQRINAPVEIVAYARPGPIVRRAVKELVSRYQDVKPDISLRIVDPDSTPAETRRLGIKTDGELAVHLGDRVEVVRRLGEHGLTAALQRLALRGDRWIAYVTGHGERDMLGGANHDLGQFGHALKERGYSVQPLNLATIGTVPDNVALVVVTQPQTDYLPAEFEVLDNYIAQGGNLLWLDDPYPETLEVDRLKPLRAQLGLLHDPGVVVDPTSQRPEIAIVSDAGDHPMVADFSLNTLFPLASAMRWQPQSKWRTQGILPTVPHAWLETSPVSGEVAFDEKLDRRGPLPLGVILERDNPSPGSGSGSGSGTNPANQRVVVIGDGDFLSNAYSGNGGNLQLGLTVASWLSHEDALLNIPLAAAPDLRFEPGLPGQALIHLGSPLLLPLASLLAGFAIWRRRRRR